MNYTVLQHGPLLSLSSNNSNAHINAKYVITNIAPSRDEDNIVFYVSGKNSNSIYMVIPSSNHINDGGLLSYTKCCYVYKDAHKHARYIKSMVCHPHLPLLFVTFREGVMDDNLSNDEAVDSVVVMNYSQAYQAAKAVIAKSHCHSPLAINTLCVAYAAEVTRVHDMMAELQVKSKGKSELDDTWAAEERQVFGIKNVFTHAMVTANTSSDITAGASATITSSTIDMRSVCTLIPIAKVEPFGSDLDSHMSVAHITFQTSGDLCAIQWAHQHIPHIQLYNTHHDVFHGSNSEYSSSGGISPSDYMHQFDSNSEKLDKKSAAVLALQPIADYILDSHISTHGLTLHPTEPYIVCLAHDKVVSNSVKTNSVYANALASINKTLHGHARIQQYCIVLTYLSNPMLVVDTCVLANTDDTRYYSDVRWLSCGNSSQRRRHRDCMLLTSKSMPLEDASKSTPIGEKKILSVTVARFSPHWHDAHAILRHFSDRPVVEIPYTEVYDLESRECNITNASKNTDNSNASGGSEANDVKLTDHYCASPKYNLLIRSMGRDAYGLSNHDTEKNLSMVMLHVSGTSISHTNGGHGNNCPMTFQYSMTKCSLIPFPGGHAGHPGANETTPSKHTVKSGKSSLYYQKILDLPRYSSNKINRLETNNMSNSLQKHRKSINDCSSMSPYVCFHPYSMQKIKKRIGYLRDKPVVSASASEIENNGHRMLQPGGGNMKSRAKDQKIQIGFHGDKPKKASDKTKEEVDLLDELEATVCEGFFIPHSLQSIDLVSSCGIGNHSGLSAVHDNRTDETVSKMEEVKMTWNIIKGATLCPPTSTSSITNPTCGVTVTKELVFNPTVCMTMRCDRVNTGVDAAAEPHPSSGTTVSFSNLKQLVVFNMVHDEVFHQKCVSQVRDTQERHLKEKTELEMEKKSRKLQVRKEREKMSEKMAVENSGGLLDMSGMDDMVGMTSGSNVPLNSAANDLLSLSFDTPPLDQATARTSTVKSDVSPNVESSNGLPTVGLLTLNPTGTVLKCYTLVPSYNEPEDVWLMQDSPTYSNYCDGAESTADAASDSVTASSRSTVFDPFGSSSTPISMLTTPTNGTTIASPEAPTDSNPSPTTPPTAYRNKLLYEIHLNTNATAGDAGTLAIEQVYISPTRSLSSLTHAFSPAALLSASVSNGPATALYMPWSEAKPARNVTMNFLMLCVNCDYHTVWSSITEVQRNLQSPFLASSTTGSWLESTHLFTNPMCFLLEPGECVLELNFQKDAFSMPVTWKSSAGTEPKANSQMVGLLTTKRVCILEVNVTSKELNCISSTRCSGSSKGLGNRRDNGGLHCPGHGVRSISWIGDALSYLLPSGIVCVLLPHAGYDRTAHPVSLFSVPEHIMCSDSSGFVRLLGYLPDRCYLMVGGNVVSRPCIPIEPIIMGILRRNSNLHTGANALRIKKMLYDLVLLFYPSAYFLNSITTMIGANPSAHCTKALCEALFRHGLTLCSLLVAGVCTNTKESLRIANSSSHRSCRWLSEVYRFELTLRAAHGECLYADCGTGPDTDNIGISCKKNNAISQSLIDIACCELLSDISGHMDSFLDPEGSGGSLPNPNSSVGRRYRIASQLCMITGHYVASLKLCDLSGDDSLIIYLMLLHTLSVMSSKASNVKDSNSGSSNNQDNGQNILEGASSKIHIHIQKNDENIRENPVDFEGVKGVSKIVSRMLALICAVNKEKDNESSKTNNKIKSNSKQNCILLPTSESVNSINELFSILIKRIQGLYDTLHGTKKNPLLQIVLHYIIRVLSANSEDFTVDKVKTLNKPTKFKALSSGGTGLGTGGGLGLPPPGKGSKLSLAPAPATSGAASRRRASMAANAQKPGAIGGGLLKPPGTGGANVEARDPEHKEVNTQPEVKSDLESKPDISVDSKTLDSSLKGTLNTDAISASSDRVQVLPAPPSHWHIPLSGEYYSQLGCTMEDMYLELLMVVRGASVGSKASHSKPMGEITSTNLKYISEACGVVPPEGGRRMSVLSMPYSCDSERVNENESKIGVFPPRCDKIPTNSNNAAPTTVYTLNNMETKYRPLVYHEYYNRGYVQNYLEPSSDTSNSVIELGAFHGAGLPSGFLPLYTYSGDAFSTTAEVPGQAAPGTLSKTVASSLGQLLRDSVEEYMLCSSNQLETHSLHGSSGNALKNQNATRMPNGQLPNANQSGNSSTLNSKYVAGVGEATGKEHDLVVGYWRFSDIILGTGQETNQNVYEVNFTSTSPTSQPQSGHPSTLCNMVDLSKYSTPLEFVYTKGQAMVCIFKESSSNVDPGGEGGHEKVKLLYDAEWDYADAKGESGNGKHELLSCQKCMRSFLQTGFIKRNKVDGSSALIQWGFKSPVYTGSSMDIGCYHVNEVEGNVRNCATYEMTLFIPNHKEGSGSSEESVVLLCRTINNLSDSTAKAKNADIEQALMWALVYHPQTHSLSIVVHSDKSKGISNHKTAQNSIPSNPYDADSPSAGTWSHIVLILDSSKNLVNAQVEANRTDFSVLVNGERVGNWKEEDLLSSAPYKPNSDNLNSATPRGYLYLLPNIAMPCKVTEFRVWAGVRSSTDLDKQRDNYLALASKRKRLQFRIKGAKTFFSGLNERYLSDFASLGVSTPPEGLGSSSSGFGATDPFSSTDAASPASINANSKSVPLSGPSGTGNVLKLPGTAASGNLGAPVGTGAGGTKLSGAAARRRASMAASKPLATFTAPSTSTAADHKKDSSFPVNFPAAPSTPAIPSNSHEKQSLGDENGSYIVDTLAKLSRTPTSTSPSFLIASELERCIRTSSTNTCSLLNSFSKDQNQSEPRFSSLDTHVCIVRRSFETDGATEHKNTEAVTVTCSMPTGTDYEYCILLQNIPNGETRLYRLMHYIDSKSKNGVSYIPESVILLFSSPKVEIFGLSVGNRILILQCASDCAYRNMQLNQPYAVNSNNRDISNHCCEMKLLHELTLPFPLVFWKPRPVVAKAKTNLEANEDVELFLNLLLISPSSLFHWKCEWKGSVSEFGVDAPKESKNLEEFAQLSALLHRATKCPLQHKPVKLIDRNDVKLTNAAGMKAQSNWADRRILDVTYSLNEHWILVRSCLRVVPDGEGQGTGKTRSPNMLEYFNSTMCSLYGSIGGSGQYSGIYKAYNGCFSNSNKIIFCMPGDKASFASAVSNGDHFVVDGQETVASTPYHGVEVDLSTITASGTAEMTYELLSDKCRHCHINVRGSNPFPHTNSKFNINTCVYVNCAPDGALVVDYLGRVAHWKTPTDATSTATFTMKRLPSSVSDAHSIQLAEQNVYSMVQNVARSNSLYGYNPNSEQLLLWNEK